MSQELSTNFTLEMEPTGSLTFVAQDGTRTEKAKPVRLFPLTDPDSWIAVVSPDGRELACVEDLQTLPEAVRATLLAACGKRDFVPIIKSIKSVTRAANGHTWTVITDRGESIFQTESDESIQPLGHDRVVVIDSRNTRYLVPDVNKLDSKSRQKLERYY
jgi:hypothetical protein